jgi:hypothetical protein
MTAFQHDLRTGKNALQPGAAEDPLKKADGVVPDHHLIALGFQEAAQVVEAGIGGIQLDKGGLDKPEGVSHLFSLFWKAGQCWPVEWKTSMEGRFRHLMPKMAQERGNAGSQVTLKWAQRRQLG